MTTVRYDIDVANTRWSKLLQVLQIPQLDTHQTYTLEIGDYVFIPCFITEKFLFKGGEEQQMLLYVIRWKLKDELLVQTDTAKAKLYGVLQSAGWNTELPY